MSEIVVHFQGNDVCHDINNATLECNNDYFPEQVEIVNIDNDDNVDDNETFLLIESYTAKHNDFESSEKVESHGRKIITKYYYHHCSEEYDGMSDGYNNINENKSREEFFLKLISYLDKQELANLSACSQDNCHQNLLFHKIIHLVNDIECIDSIAL